MVDSVVRFYILVVCKRIKPNHTELCIYIKFKQIFILIFQILSVNGPLGLFPSVWHLPGDPFKFHLIKNKLNIIDAHIKNHMNGHRTQEAGNLPEDFIQAYLSHMDSQASDSHQTVFNGMCYYNN